MKRNGVESYFNENLFGDLCDRGADDSINKIDFCRNFIKTAITVRLAAGVCLIIGGYFVSAAIKSNY